MGIPSYETQSFNVAAQGERLQDQNILSIGRNGGESKVKGYGSHVQNFQDILKSGEIKQHGHDDAKVPDAWKNLQLDVNRDDALGRSMQQIRQNTNERIAKDPDMQALMQKGNWDRNDRVAYERKLTTFVEEETSKVPGLKDYRTPSKNPDSKYDPNINNLSQDIENNTQTKRFDCTTQSAIQGSTMQMVENDQLPEKAAEGNMRVRSNYFYANGASDGSNHAWVVSSATGNMIETTSTGIGDKYSTPGYKEPLYGDKHSFDDLVKGRPFISYDHQVYGARDMSKDDVSKEYESVMKKNGTLDRMYRDMPAPLPEAIKNDPKTPLEILAMSEMKELAQNASRVGETSKGQQQGTARSTEEWAKKQFNEIAVDSMSGANRQDVEGWMITRRMQDIRERRFTEDLAPPAAPQEQPVITRTASAQQAAP